MRRNRQLLLTITALTLLGAPAVVPKLRVSAETANAPSLVISQLKISSSNGQFVTLYNPGSASLDMSKYQLEYFNNYDLSKATSSRLIALSGMVPPHGYFMVNDSALLLCYQLTVDSVSLGFSSTAGMVEVLAFNQSSPGSSVTPVLQDYVGWSKTAATGAQTLPVNTNAFLLRQPFDSKNNPAVGTPGSGSWQTVQPDSNNACNLVTAAGTPIPVSTGLSQLLLASEPPATIISLSGEVTPTPASTPAAGLPAADIGLIAPKITELLPNPNGTGNDSSEEFIELYNSNVTSFDLTGFALQVGTTSLHNFVFPVGSSLPPQSFKAFYASDTGLSLSNIRSQAKLLDPPGNVIDITEVYASAKDGQAWALANGKWYWTLKLTPGEANIIEQPPSGKKPAAVKTVSAGTKTSAKTSAKTGKPAAAGKVKAAKTKLTKTAAVSHSSAKPSTSPIHLWTLALVAGLAVLYGIYEYRGDLANRIYVFRRYLKARRANRT